MSEEMLVCHCAPTLAGIKTGSMFSCTYGCKADIVSAICHLNQKLVPKGLCVLPLRYRSGRVLIYVYRPSKLAADLADHRAHTLLEEAGYSGRGINQCVRELVCRLDSQSAFPHEIGLFLSYPPEDVRGFMEHKGDRCKCVGYWKVYGDAEKARATFARYQRCTEHYLAQWSRGMNLERLAVVRYG